MKIKKSKIVMPSLALLLLSTAASVTGSVAWFTANRTYNLTAGDFAVVNTKGNLQCEITSGIGTIADDGARTITTEVDYKLTDASFDLTDYNQNKLPIIEPDENGERVGDKNGFAAVGATGAAASEDTEVNPAKTYYTAAASTGAGYLDDGTNHFTKVANPTGNPSTSSYYELTTLGYNAISEAELLRDADEDVYSAFSWNMTFKYNFAVGADKKVGLFLDLSSANTWAHKKDGVVFDEEHIATAEEAGTWYTNPELTTGAVTFTAGSATGVNGTYYRAAPLDTGKGFRIAIVPTAIPTGSLGVTKVWAPHQVAEDVEFIDGLERGALLTPSELGTENTATTSMAGNTYAAATVEAGKAAMVNGDVTAAPAQGDISSTTALSSNSNFLGYFGPSAGNTVELSFVCYAYYEGTDPTIVNTAETIYETMHASMEFAVSKLSD